MFQVTWWTVNKKMADEWEDDDIPDLVPANVEKVPITIITGFLGWKFKLEYFSFQIIIPYSM